MRGYGQGGDAINKARLGANATYLCRPNEWIKRNITFTKREAEYHSQWRIAQNTNRWPDK